MSEFITILIAVLLVTGLIYGLKQGGGSPWGKGPDSMRDLKKTYGMGGPEDMEDDFKPK